MGGYSVVLLGLVVLGVLSFWQDSHNPAVAKQLEKQHDETRAYMAAPFKPHLIGAASTAKATPPSPLIREGQTVFTGQGCNSCHGRGGVGTAMAPSLVGVGSKFPPDKLAAIIRNPPARVAAGGMPSFDLSDTQMNALVQYLDSLE